MWPFNRKSATVTTETLEQIGGWLSWARYSSTASGAAVGERTALDTPVVFCASRVIAEGCSQIPCRVMRDEFTRDGLRRSRPAVEHWAHRLLAVKPNSWQTSYEFREGMFFSAAIGVGALAIKNFNGAGQIQELLPVPPGAWSVKQNKDYSLEYSVTLVDRQQVKFSEDEVFFFRGPSWDGINALPAVRQAREAIGLSQALEKQQARLAGNGGKPSGVLSFVNPLKPETRAKLAKTWTEKFGPNGEGGVAILDGDASFSSMTMTSVDAQYVETRRIQVEEIARAFRVQPIMLMQADKAATYASAEQMFRMHVVHTLGPWMRRFEEAARRDILGNQPSLRVDLDERGLMRGDFKDQAEYYTKALGAGGQPGWMTPNEVRAERDMNPVNEDWADRVPRGAMEQSDGT